MELAKLKELFLIWKLYYSRVLCGEARAFFRGFVYGFFMPNGKLQFL